MSYCPFNRAAQCGTLRHTAEYARNTNSREQFKLRLKTWLFEHAYV